MTKINHDLRSVDGQTIYLPPEIAGQPYPSNIRLPNVYQEDTSQLYPLGTRFVSGERVYHYYKAGADIAYTLSALFSNKAMLADGVNTHDAVLAGVTKIKVDGTGAGNPVANAWAGGYILTIGLAAAYRTNMRIVSSLAAETDTPYAVELTLEQPLPYAVADDTNVEIFPNRYASCISTHATGSGTGMTCVGMPARGMTSGSYGWVQTWGPSFAVRAAELMEADGDRQLCVAYDGSLRAYSYVSGGHAVANSWQMIGYSLAISGTGGGWFFLTIDP